MGQKTLGLFVALGAAFVMTAFTGCGGGGGGSSGSSNTTTTTITATATTTPQNLVARNPMVSFSPLTASGGTAPYTYSNAGALPAGINLDPATGVVSGTPTAAYATASVVFSVKDANNNVASTTSTVSFTVAQPWIGTRQLGGVGWGDTYGTSVATDAYGNVYVAGTTQVGLDGNTQTGPTDFFLTKYDASGTRLYTRQLGAPGAGIWLSSMFGYNGGVYVATDANGNVYVAGTTYGGLDGNRQTGIADLFLTKYDASGTRLYTRQLGFPGGSTQGNSVATDAYGNVYVAGTTSGGLDGNRQTGIADLFLTKYDASGTRLYTRQLGAFGANTYGSSVATDAYGNVYVAGHTRGGLDGNTLTGVQDFFVTKYDASGTRLYTRQLGVAGLTATYGNSVATDAYGNVFIAGSTTGGLDGNTLTGNMGSFVTKYDASGTRLYTRLLGGAPYGNSVATDAYGNVYVAGSTFGVLNGNTQPGNFYFFVTKYDASGTKLYTRQLGFPGGSTQGNSVATDAYGNVYVAGFTNGGLDGNTLMGSIDFFVTKFNSAGVKQ